MQIHFSNDILILFTLFSSISINIINGIQQCIERQCISNTSQWCCPYNTTCGNQNTCDDIRLVSRQSFCLNKLVCTRDQYYWCCNNDQTCGNFRQCENSDSSTITMIAVFTTIGVGSTLFIIICLICIRYQCHRNTNNTQAVDLSHSIQGLQPPFFLLSGIESHGQVYTSSNIEEPPPSYNAIELSSITQNQDRV